MNLEWFIACRIARPAPGNRPGVMVRIAVWAVALSVAVMIVALAVVMGFRREITDRVAGFSAHVVLTDRRSDPAVRIRPVPRTEALESLVREAGEVERIAPYAVRGGVVKSGDAIVPLLLKGVDGSYDASFFERYLVEGSFPRVGDSLRTKELLLSRETARRARLAPGDRVELLFLEEDGALRRDRFKVSGLYFTGMESFDRMLALTDLRNVQRLCGFAADEVAGYEIALRRPDEAQEYASRLNDALFFSGTGRDYPHLAAADAQRAHAGVFDWLRTHDVNAAVVLAIMTVVALFNMSVALLTLVFERTRMIGLLKTLGMGNRSIRRIFLYRASLTVVRGVAWGNAIGLGICLMQRCCHLVRLDPEGYVLSEMPVAFGLGWWLALNVGVVAVIVALLVVPASLIAHVRPDEAIRYNS
ncbi:MAG: ABC transporter permease [Alistipes sp.]|nr:ABC transporter permease [Alistipes sp.]